MRIWPRSTTAKPRAVHALRPLVLREVAFFLPSGRAKRNRATLERVTRVIGAADETRTHDIHLGKVVLYQLSYGRVVRAGRIRPARRGVNGTLAEKIEA